MLLKGRPVSLTVLDYGFFRVHSGPRDIGLMGALIQTDAGERVLIDTGMPSKYARTAEAAGLEDGLDTFGEVLSLTEVNLPAAQLALCGVDEIDLMIVSHTHIDHIGGLFDFPDVPTVISAPERALARPLYWTGGQPWLWPDRVWRVIEEDTELGPGFQSFLCPGHAPGQLAFMCELPESGRVLWTSDAISRPSEVDERFLGSWDEKQALFHAERLLALEPDLIIYGHCPTQWAELRKAPERYQ